MKYKQLCILFILISGVVVGCSRGPDRLEGITFIALESNWSMTEVAWSPDGKQLALTAHSEHEDRIYIVDLESETYQPIKEYNDRIPYEVYGPTWSPDSRMLALYYPPAVVGEPGQPVKLSSNSIVTINAQTRELHQGVWDGIYVTWSTHQDEVIVVDSDKGQSDQEVPIYLINLSTGEVRELTKTLASFVIPFEALDASSTGLLAYQNEGRLNIINIFTGELEGEIEVESRLYSPAWSPDGEILAYVQDVENEDGKKWRGIYFSTTNGLCRSEPLDVGSIVKSIDWSPNGAKMVFTTNEHGKIYFLDLANGVGNNLLNSFQDRCEN